MCGSIRRYVIGIYPQNSYPGTTRMNDKLALNEGCYTLKIYSQNICFKQKSGKCKKIIRECTCTFKRIIQPIYLLFNHSASRSEGNIPIDCQVLCQLKCLCDIKMCSRNNNFPTLHPRSGRTFYPCNTSFQ